MAAAHNHLLNLFRRFLDAPELVGQVEARTGALRAAAIKQLARLSPRTFGPR